MFRTLTNWLFDGARNSKIPEPRKNEDGKWEVADIRQLPTFYVVGMFVNHGALTTILNKYLNNVNLYYLSSEDVLYFLKKCIYDFKVRKESLVYTKKKESDILFDALRERLPQFKNTDLSLLCDLIQDSNEKDQIYHTLGLETTKKTKVKVGNKKTKKKNITLKSVIEEYFSIYRSTPQ